MNNPIINNLKIHNIKYLIPIFMFLFSSNIAAEELTGNKIAYDSEEKYNGDTQSSDSTMILIDPDGNRRVRKMKSFRKDFGNELKDEKSVYFFSYPNDIKDTSYLNFDWIEEGKDDDSWLFLPSLKKVERLAAADKSDAFLGSDFTYTDIKTYQRQYWDYSIIRDSDNIDGADCWMLEGVPKKGNEENVIKETGYYKVQSWIRKDNLLIVKGIFWVDKGKKIKYFKASDIENIDGIWTAKTNQMVTTKQGRVEHSTVLKLENVLYNQKIDDTFFTPQRMTRGIL